MRDQRDPQALGERIENHRAAMSPWHRERGLSQYIDVMDLSVPDYDGGGLMSNDPALHHSKVKQDAYIESDGGE